MAGSVCAILFRCDLGIYWERVGNLEAGAGDAFIGDALRSRLTLLGTTLVLERSGVQATIPYTVN